LAIIIVLAIGTLSTAPLFAITGMGNGNGNDNDGNGDIQRDRVCNDSDDTTRDGPDDDDDDQMEKRLTVGTK